MRRCAIVVVAFFIVCSGCNSDSAPSAKRLSLETEDPRFEIFLDQPQATQDISSSETRNLTLRVQPKTGWHIEPNAPTRLDLRSPSGLEIDTPLLGGAKGVTSSQEKIEFEIAYRVTGRAGKIDREASAESRLKFGVCREGNLRCEIVTREIQIPLH